MNTLLPRRYSFRHEILPVAVVEIMLNLVAHYLVDKPPNFIFGDMGGTALAAILLGPWWAATFGMLSSAITGSFQFNYFPFGVVQVAGALTWGYLARVRWIRVAIFDKDKPGHVKNLIYSYFILVLSGGMVCALVSSIVKLMLYPRMGLPLHTNQPIYLNALHFLTNHGLTKGADSVSLLMGDQARELTDKALLVLLALVFAKFMGFIPDKLERSTESLPTSRLEPFKADAVAILSFAFTYAIYLLMARIIQPHINIRNAPYSIDWLREPPVLALLYAPLMLAIISFLFLSYGPQSPVGRWLDAGRKKRDILYNAMVSPARFSSVTVANSEVFHLLKADGVYGLLFTVLLWPSKGSVLGGAVNSTLIYFGVMAAFAGVFFYRRREFSSNFCRATSWSKTLHKWVHFPNQDTDAASLLRMLSEIFKGHMEVVESGVRRQGPISYLPAEITSEKGYLHDLSSEKADRRLLLILPDRPGNFTTEVRETIDALFASTQISIAIIFTLSPLLVEESAVSWLQKVDQSGKVIMLLGLEDTEEAIYENVKVGVAEMALARGRIHVLDSLVPKTNNSLGLRVEDGVESLASRAHPYVRHLLAKLPEGSLILDLGAGRGRHVVTALKLGHRVVAIERNPKAVQDLESFAAQLGDIHGRLDLRCEDYLNIEPESVGLVDVVIAASVLQHTSDADDLKRHLLLLQSFASAPGSILFIEMLFDMTFDGQPPGDGRFDWTQGVFEEILCTEFPSPVWRIELVRGPQRSCQSFDQGPRSFLAPATRIGSTSMHYRVSREA